MLKLKTMLLLATTLISCRNNPDSHPKLQDLEQLSPVFRYVTIDGKEYIDVEKSVCLSRVYRIGRDQIGPRTEALELNIKECNKVVGYAPLEYVTFFDWMVDMRDWLIDQIY